MGSFFLRKLVWKDLMLVIGQHFVPVWLIEKWVRWTNAFALSRRSENLPLRARLRIWRPASVKEVYLWLGVLIYLVIHPESSVRDHWKTSGSESQLATHAVIQVKSEVTS